MKKQIMVLLVSIACLQSSQVIEAYVMKNKSGNAIRVMALAGRNPKENLADYSALIRSDQLAVKMDDGGLPKGSRIFFLKMTKVPCELGMIDLRSYTAEQINSDDFIIEISPGLKMTAAYKGKDIKVFSLEEEQSYGTGRQLFGSLHAFFTQLGAGTVGSTEVQLETDDPKADLERGYALRAQSYEDEMRAKEIIDRAESKLRARKQAESKRVVTESAVAQSSTQAAAGSAGQGSSAGGTKRSEHPTHAAGELQERPTKHARVESGQKSGAGAGSAGASELESNDDMAVLARAQKVLAKALADAMEAQTVINAVSVRMQAKAKA